MSNETNNVYAAVRENDEVMAGNTEYYSQQPQNSNDDVNVNESDSLTERVKHVRGVVSDCDKLNIRREAQKRKDNVVCVISGGDVLLIDEEQSTNAWFYVTTASGISGYCMKEFVTLE